MQQKQFKSVEQNNTSGENTISYIVLGLLFIYMWYLNWFMPLHRDDYEYSLIWGTTDKIMSFADVILSLSYHYFFWGGRMVAFFVLDNFLLLGKEWFNPLNAFLFVFLIVLIYWHAMREVTWRFNPYILVTIIAFIWLGLPHFGEVAIWMTGSCVYLLTAVLIFSMLLPYHFYLLKRNLLPDNFFSVIGMLLLGILSGWTVENTSATSCFIIFCTTWYCYKKKIHKRWMFSGLLGAIIGLALLVGAPGNYSRAAIVKTKFVFHVANLFAAGGELLLYILPIILFLVIVWRILLLDYIRSKGIACTTTAKSIFGKFSMISFSVIIIMLLSYINDGIVSKYLGWAFINNVAVPLKFATPKLQNQLFNTLSGLEEMVMYLLGICFLYNSIINKLGLTKKNLRPIAVKFKFREVIKAYPDSYYSLIFIGLAIFNHLVMIASPRFPARSCFGSVIFLVIGAVSLLTIPVVKNYLLGLNSKKYFMATLGIVVLPMMLATFLQYQIIHVENTARLHYAEHLSAQGAKDVVFEPINLKNKVLRHVYFVELNNHVSKYGFCIFYGFDYLTVKES